MIESVNISEKTAIKLQSQSKENYNIIGKVTIKNKVTGEILEEGYNKTLLSGSEFLAMRSFDLENDDFVTPSYNSIMNFDYDTLNAKNDIGEYKDKTLDYKICLFAIGTSGAARGSLLKLETNKQKWIAPPDDSDKKNIIRDLIAFRYCNTNNDLSEEERTIYFGRKSLPEINKYAYYFKKFDSQSLLTKTYDDGTEWTNSVYSDNVAQHANVIVTNVMTISPEDARDYFSNTEGLSEARFNCVELLLAWPRIVNGITYYQDIRPFSRFNFTNKSLSDTDDIYEITYSLYF